jgi:hypothetical protein
MATALLRRPLRLRGLPTIPRTFTASRGYAVDTPAPGKRTAVYYDRPTGFVEDLQDIPADNVLAEAGVNRKDVKMRHFTGVVLSILCIAVEKDSFAGV